MLPISNDEVAEVIILARELDRAEGEYYGFVEQMTEEEQAALVAIFWIGRGSYEPEDVQEAYEAAVAESTIPTSEYLRGSPHLAEHLEAGLAALGVDAGAEEDALLGRL